MSEHIEASKSQKIFVVDDDPDQLFIASRALKRAGYQVETADNIWIAHKVGEFRPDLILMDVQFANFQNGPVAVKALKKNQLGRDTIVLLYSTMPETDLAALVVECGADGYVCKHEGPASLIHEVRRHLDRRALHTGTALPDVANG